MSSTKAEIAFVKALGTGKHKTTGRSAETREQLLFNYVKSLPGRKFSSQINARKVYKAAVEELLKEIEKNGSKRQLIIRCPQCGHAAEFARK
jgi:hypothetical protein